MRARHIDVVMQVLGRLDALDLVSSSIALQPERFDSGDLPVAVRRCAPHIAHHAAYVEVFRAKEDRVRDAELLHVALSLVLALAPSLCCL